MTEPLYIDTSTLKAVAQCSTLASLRYQLGWTTLEEAAPLKAGTAFHRLAEVWFRGGTRDEALAAFTDEYDQWGRENVTPGDRLDPANLLRVCAHWLDTHPVLGFPFTIERDYVEVGFAYPLTKEGDIVFTGRMDAFARSHEDRETYIVENKSTGRIDETWAEQWFMDPQLSGYIWAGEQHVGRPVVGAYVNAIEFSRVPSSDRRCSVHGVKYTECGPMHINARLLIVQRSPEEIAQWHKDAIHLARKYQEMCKRYPDLESLHRLRTQGKWNGTCRWCGFRAWCKIGRPLEHITGFMRHEPWSPFAYAFGDATPTGHKP